MTRLALDYYAQRAVEQVMPLPAELSGQPIDLLGSQESISAYSATGPNREEFIGKLTGAITSAQALVMPAEVTKEDSEKLAQALALFSASASRLLLPAGHVTGKIGPAYLEAVKPSEVALSARRACGCIVPREREGHNYLGTEPFEIHLILSAMLNNSKERAALLVVRDTTRSQARARTSKSSGPLHYAGSSVSDKNCQAMPIAINDPVIRAANREGRSSSRTTSSSTISIKPKFLSRQSVL